MMIKTVLLFLILYETNADLFVEKRKYIYDYTGVMTIGTKRTPNTGSTVIKSTIEIDRIDDKIWFRLKNVTYDEGIDMKTDRIAVKDSSYIINVPFASLRFTNSTKIGIITGTDDVQWSKNIKHAILNLFYVDDRILNADKHLNFESDEWIYHKHGDDNNINVTKISSDDYIKKYQNRYLTINRKREYKIGKNDDSLTIEEITSKCIIETKHIEKFQIVINQNVLLKCVKDDVIFKTPDISNIYHLIDPNRDIDEYYDLNDISKESVLNDLIAIRENFKIPRITMNYETINDKESINHLLNRLIFMNDKDLRDLYEAISKYHDDKLSNLMLQMLSLTGKSEIYMFIIELVSKSDMNERDIDVLLQNMSKYLNSLHPKFIKKLYKIVEDKDENGILALAAILSRFDRENEIVDKIIDKLESTKYDFKRILYLSALRNVKSNRTNDYLMGYALNGTFDVESRIMAILCVENVASNHDFYWLLFTDKRESKRLRYTVLHLLTDLEYPDNLERISIYLDNEDDVELKKYFYKILDSVSTLTLPRYRNIADLAKRLMPSNFKIVNDFTGSNYLADYIDDYGFDSILSLTHYGIPGYDDFTSIHFKYIDSFLNDEQVYVNIKWPKNIIRKFKSIADLIMFEMYRDCEVYMIRISGGRVNSVIGIKLNNIKQSLNEVLNDNLYVNRPVLNEIVKMTDMGIPFKFYDHISTVYSGGILPIPFWGGAAFYNYIREEIYGFTIANPLSNSTNGIRRVHSLKGQFLTFLSSSLVRLADNTTGIQSYVYNEVFLKSLDKKEPSARIINEDDALKNVIYTSDSGKTRISVDFQYQLI